MVLSQKQRPHEGGRQTMHQSVPIEARLLRTYALTRPEVSGIVS
jgi:hypothetical protein